LFEQLDIFWSFFTAELEPVCTCVDVVNIFHLIFCSSSMHRFASGCFSCTSTHSTQFSKVVVPLVSDTVPHYISGLQFDGHSHYLFCFHFV